MHACLFVTIIRALTNWRNSNFIHLIMSPRPFQSNRRFIISPERLQHKFRHCSFGNSTNAFRLQCSCCHSAARNKLRDVVDVSRCLSKSGKTALLLLLFIPCTKHHQSYVCRFPATTFVFFTRANCRPARSQVSGFVQTVGWTLCPSIHYVDRTSAAILLYIPWNAQSSDDCLMDVAMEYSLPADCMQFWKMTHADGDGRADEKWRTGGAPYSGSRNSFNLQLEIICAIKDDGLFNTSHSFVKQKSTTVPPAPTIFQTIAWNNAKSCGLRNKIWRVMTIQKHAEMRIRSKKVGWFPIPSHDSRVRLSYQLKMAVSLKTVEYRTATKGVHSTVK